jgi:hypothetical protein
MEKKIREIGREDLKFIKLDNRIQWYAFVNMVMSIQMTQKWGFSY